MDRREFFRRTVPAVAVTVAASQCGWSLDAFKRLLRRVLTKIENSHEAEIIRQLKYQTKMALNAMADRMGEWFYGNPNGVLASIDDEPRRLIPVEYKLGFSVT